ncbi:MAG TPA: hypothetical protein VIP77_22120 [Jiangellaceae bacterium]
MTTKTQIRLLVTASVLMILIAIVHESAGYYLYVDPLTDHATGVPSNQGPRYVGEPVLMTQTMYLFVGFVFLGMGLAPAWAARAIRRGDHAKARALLVGAAFLLWSVVAVFIATTLAVRGLDEVLILPQWPFFLPSLVLVHVVLRGLAKSSDRPVAAARLS